MGAGELFGFCAIPPWFIGHSNVYFEMRMLLTLTYCRLSQNNRSRQYSSSRSLLEL